MGPTINAPFDASKWLLGLFWPGSWGGSYCSYPFALTKSRGETQCVWWVCGDADVCRLGNTVEKPWVGWRRDLWARG